MIYLSLNRNSACRIFLTILGNSFIDPQEIDTLNCDANDHNDANKVSTNANDNITFLRNDVHDINQSSLTRMKDYDNGYPDGKKHHNINHQPTSFRI